MIYSEKERLEIYKKVLNTLFKTDWTIKNNSLYSLYSYKSYSKHPFICDLLRDYTEYIGDEIIKQFPEFALFEPVYNYELEWWNLHDIDSRIIAIDFCIAMLEN